MSTTKSSNKPTFEELEANYQESLEELRKAKGLSEERPASINTRPDMELTDTFTFGKYKGQSLQYVIDTDPGYINWIEDNEVVGFTEDVWAYINWTRDQGI